MGNKPRSCPSSKATEGSVLLGVINPDGVVGYIGNKTIVTGELYEEIHKKKNPEKHFRFSNRCAESGCRQWQDEKCSVITGIFEANADLELEAQLPNCSIRKSCRWYFQEGPKACTFCPYIITDMLDTRTAEGI